MRSAEARVQYWDDPDYDHTVDAFWVKEAMERAVGKFWLDHVFQSGLSMPSITVTLNSDRGVVVAYDGCIYDCSYCNSDEDD